MLGKAILDLALDLFELAARLDDFAAGRLDQRVPVTDRLQTLVQRLLVLGDAATEGRERIALGEIAGNRVGFVLDAAKHALDRGPKNGDQYESGDNADGPTHVSILRGVTE